MEWMPWQSVHTGALVIPRRDAAPAGGYESYGVEGESSGYLANLRLEGRLSLPESEIIDPGAVGNLARVVVSELAGRAVDQDSAGAAFTQLAAMLRAGKIHVFAQDFQQRFIDFGGYLLSFTVNSQVQNLFHNLKNLLALSSNRGRVPQETIST